MIVQVWQGIIPTLQGNSTTMNCQRFAVRIDPENPSIAERLATDLNLQTISDPNSETPEFILEFDTAGRLTLRDNLFSELKPIRADLSPRYRGRGFDPLLRALGSRSSSVIDTTAGLGTDTAQIAASGKMVQALEVHPVLHALLADALVHCSHPKIRRSIKLQRGDAVTWLETASPQPDVIYLDPMYPPSKGNAAPRKEVQILRKLCEHDPVSDQKLLEAAMRQARYRVVVKRPHHAPPLLPGRRGNTRGKLVRFDIYTP